MNALPHKSGLIAALEWIRDNADDEGACDQRSACGNSFHTTMPPYPTPPNHWCPDCYSSWWAVDGTGPSEPSATACEAVARKALAEPLEVTLHSALMNDPRGPLWHERSEIDVVVDIVMDVLRGKS